MQSGAVTNFVFQELDAHRPNFKGMTFQQVVTKIETSDEYFNSFKKYINSTDSFVELDSSKNYIKRYLAAEFCRQLFGENQYYRVVLKEDAMIKTALKY
jgi:carboxyl-terminal processing protease